MKKSEVAMQRGDAPKETVARTLRLLGGLEGVIAKGDTVLISPNYCGPVKWDTGTTTNPEVVVGVIEAAKEAGAEEVIVAESAMVGLDAGEVMRELGVQEVLEKAGSRVLNLDMDPSDFIEIIVSRG